ncbi:hypothetical protein L3Q82_008302 [Scortum barcoo]|uniref:Uncharacterized protein n=1 Tax=Scortum barcoo TaxID=214431 RepID=A0ACB8WGW0_9TELE|nr:hypothetical protein L3Q82_008302 [Scortum barcoo]
MNPQQLLESVFTGVSIVTETTRERLNFFFVFWSPTKKTLCHSQHFIKKRIFRGEIESRVCYVQERGEALKLQARRGSCEVIKILNHSQALPAKRNPWLQNTTKVHLQNTSAIQPGEDIVFSSTDMNLLGTVDWVKMRPCIGFLFTLVLTWEKCGSNQHFFSIVQLIRTYEQAKNFAHRLNLKGHLTWKAMSHTIYKIIAMSMNIMNHCFFHDTETYSYLCFLCYANPCLFLPCSCVPAYLFLPLVSVSAPETELEPPSAPDGALSVPAFPADTSPELIRCCRPPEEVQPSPAAARAFRGSAFGAGLPRGSASAAGLRLKGPAFAASRPPEGPGPALFLRSCLSVPPVIGGHQPVDPTVDINWPVELKLMRALTVQTGCDMFLNPGQMAIFIMARHIDGEQLEDGQVPTALKTTVPFEITGMSPEGAANGVASDS